MATETADNTTIQRPQPKGSRPKLRELWQVPIFLVGLLAVMGVWFTRTAGNGQNGQPGERDLAAARRALDKSPPELDRVIDLLGNLVQQPGRPPEQMGEAHFLLGSAYLFQADISSPEGAVALWQKARFHLEQAELLGAPKRDHDHFLYRIARAWFQTGEDPRRIIDNLIHSLPKGADDPAQGYDILSKAYLLLPVPDVEASLGANEKLLALPLDKEAILAPARLQRAELLLRLQRRDEARLVLANINPSAPPDTYVRGRALRAILCQQDELWPEAQKLWEEILHDSKHLPPEPAKIQFYLGMCYFRQGASADASRVWERAMISSGEAGQAAAFRLAELAMRDSNTVLARKAYNRALKDSPTPATYHNSLLDQNEACRICEDGCQIYRNLGDFDSAAKLALAYGKLAPPGRAEELLGQAVDALAREFRERAHQAKNEDEATREEQAARAHFNEAGAAYEAAADAVRGQPAETDWLWRSADRYTQGQDYLHAVAVLKRFLDRKVSNDRLAEGWFVLGTLYKVIHQESEARNAFFKCIEIQNVGAFASRARYQLAEDSINKKNFDEAEKILKQNLELMGLTPDPEAHERSLLALAGLLYQRREYRLAAVHLQQVLDRYPNNARALMARHVLADCYRRLALREKENLKNGDRGSQETKARAQEQYRQWWEMALANYQKLAEDLLTRQGMGPLSDEETAILGDAEMAEMDCLYNLGQYDKALNLAKTLVERYATQAESLVAFKQILRCYWTMGQFEKKGNKHDELTAKARDTIKQARARLNQLDEKAFPAVTEPETHSRKWWGEWLNWAESQWKPPTETTRRTPPDQAPSPPRSGAPTLSMPPAPSTSLAPLK